MRELDPAFPHSMPPHAPPSLKLTPADVLLLRRLRDALRRQARTHSQRAALREKRADNWTRRRSHYSRLWQLLGHRTFTELARLSGISVSEVSKVLRGDREPKVSTFLKLAGVLHVTAAELYDYLRETWREREAGEPLPPFRAAVRPDPLSDEEWLRPRSAMEPAGSERPRNSHHV